MGKLLKKLIDAISDLEHKIRIFSSRIAHNCLTIEADNDKIMNKNRGNHRSLRLANEKTRKKRFSSDDLSEANPVSFRQSFLLFRGNSGDKMSLNLLYFMEVLLWQKDL
ncbi:MAG: hypothetical protein J6D37_00100 [Clostridia bacterium]|nr:hypothetical protein [Clostridia bacterium]